MDGIPIIEGGKVFSFWNRGVIEMREAIGIQQATKAFGTEETRLFGGGTPRGGGGWRN